VKGGRSSPGVARSWAAKLRRPLQVAFFLAFVVLFLAMAHPLRPAVPYRLFLDLDPLVALFSAFGTRHALALAGILLVAALLFGRLFCGYVCPFGFLADLFGPRTKLVVRAGQGRASESAASEARPAGSKDERVTDVAPPLPGWLDSIPWAVLAVFLLGWALRNGLPALLDPLPHLFRLLAIVVFPAGVWVANGLLHLFRPVAEQVGWYGVAYLAFAQPGAAAGLASLVLFAAFLGLNGIAPRFWCRFLCPLGVLLALPARVSWFGRRVAPSCIKCGRCVSACPMGAVPVEPIQTRFTLCVHCRSCQDVCPVEAISFSFGNGRAPAKGKLLQNPRRRGFLLAAGLGGLALLLTRLDPRVIKKSDRRLRPPGAIPEADFLAACVRCGACLRVCPTRTLQASGAEGGLIAWGTPVHRMRTAGCEQSCNLCGKVCPTGAIRDLPLIERQHAKVGTAVLDRQRCVAWAENRLCLLCDEACPYNAIVFEVVEGHKRPVVDESRCNGCGMCEAVCPVEGEAAVVVFPAGEVRLKSGSYQEALAERRIHLEPRRDRFGPEPVSPSDTAG
jgi:MauM/NapG family ferredoxin protein